MRRRCKTCLGVAEQMSSKSDLHRCNPRVHWCTLWLHQCKTLLEDICSGTPKHVLHPLLTTFQTLTSFPGKQHGFLHPSVFPDPNGGKVRFQSFEIDLMTCMLSTCCPLQNSREITRIVGRQKARSMHVERSDTQKDYNSSGA